MNEVDLFGSLVTCAEISFMMKGHNYNSNKLDGSDIGSIQVCSPCNKLISTNALFQLLTMFVMFFEVFK